MRLFGAAGIRGKDISLSVGYLYLLAARLQYLFSLYQIDTSPRSNSRHYRN